MSRSFATYWRELAGGKRRGMADRLLLGLLIPFSLPYALFQAGRSLLYRRGILPSRSLPRPVVSVGNITVGGTGKTPATLFIARLLLSRGVRVAVLSRGYGGSLEGRTAIVSDGTTILLGAEEAGDEPFLMARTLPGLAVVIGRDRHAAGMLAMERLAPDLFLLDDGFQHLRLARDLNILLLDALRPFGNGLCLPAGLLREPRWAMNRADLVITTRSPEHASADAPPMCAPCCRAHHRLGTAIPLTGGEPLTLAALRGKRLFAFAGIAEPSDFFAALGREGLNPVATRALADHAAYSPALIDDLTAAFEQSGADCAVTTEKDGVKLGHLPARFAERVLLVRLDFTIPEPSPLLSALGNLLQK